NKIAVSMRYTEGEFEHDMDFNESNRTLEISFDKKGWVDSDHDNADVEIELLLPANVKLDFRSKIKAGEIEMEVGGLSLRRFYLKTWAGEVLVDFDEPNRIVMNSLDINIKVGETQLRNLGNARFRSADIDNGIGALDIDFSGNLPDDATAKIDLDIGETDIFIPDDLGVKLSVRKFLFLSQVNISRKLRKSGSYYFSDNYDSNDRALDLEVKPGIGELNVRYK
ncbi:MAG: LiaF domain-containing protein, partial [bacterium]